MPFPSCLRSTHKAERRALAILAPSMGISAFLILFETRSNTFFNDEIVVFDNLGMGVNPESVLEPHNGHLIAPANLVYGAVFSVAGPDPAILRVIGVIVLLTCCLLFYLLVKRMAGSMLALAATVILLLFGASWETLLWPLSELTFTLSVAFGLGALLVVERGEVKGDVAACILATLAVLSHSTGLAFLVAVAVAVLLEAGSRRRLWVFLLPLAIYAAWSLWALKFHEGLARADNIILAPSYVAGSLVAVTTSVTGLSSGPLHLGLYVPVTRTSSLVIVMALAVAVAIAARVWPGRVSGLPWVPLAALLVFWTALALSYGPGRAPEASRYLFPGAVLFLLVVAAAISRFQLPRAAMIAILAGAAFSAVVNARQLHTSEALFRDYAPLAKAELGAIEIGRKTVSPDFTPDLDTRSPPNGHLPVQAGPYLAAVDRFGSFALSPQALSEQDSQIRQVADRVLASAEQLSLRPPVGPLEPTRCERLPHEGPIDRAIRPLRPGSIWLVGDGPVSVRLGRFASSYPVALGTLVRRKPVTMSIPADAAMRPWRIAVSGARVTLCRT